MNGDYYPEADMVGADKDEAIEVEDQPIQKEVDPAAEQEKEQARFKAYGPTWDEHHQAMGQMETRMGDLRSRLAKTEAMNSDLSNQLALANQYELRGRRAADFLLNYVEGASVQAANQGTAQGPDASDGVIGSAAVGG